MTPTIYSQDASSLTTEPATVPSERAYTSAEQATEIAKVKKLTEQENTPLFDFSSMFPFSFFPTLITIERTKVNIVEQGSFGEKKIQSLLISELTSVEIEIRWIFATMTFITRVPMSQPVTVKALRPADAQRARRIIQGLISGLSARIDWTKVPVEELLPAIETLGATKAIQ